MIVSTCTLAALLALDATKSPASTGDCPVTDNLCKARRSERRAAVEPTPEHRARYLHSAHKSYLFLFDETGDPRHLCAARRTLDASIAVKEQSAAQRASFQADRRELVVREREHPAACRGVAKRRPRTADPPLVAAKVHSAGGSSPDAEAMAKLAELHEVAPPSGDSREVMTSTTAPTSDALMPITLRPPRPGPNANDSPVRSVQPTVDPRPRPALPRRPREDSRPGRGLVIAGGVTLGVGIVLTAAAGTMGRRMVETRREIFALDAMVDGYSTVDQEAMGEALIRDYRAMGRQTVALALAGGTTVVVAAVLATLGGRRMARAASRTALVPAPGGVVFHARF
jgi:hypothetical protein